MMPPAAAAAVVAIIAHVEHYLSITYQYTHDTMNLTKFTIITEVIIQIILITSVKEINQSYFYY